LIARICGFHKIGITSFWELLFQLLSSHPQLSVFAALSQLV